MSASTPESRQPTNASADSILRPVHGGIRPADLRALGLAPEGVLDFSASVSPIGPPAGVWEAMGRVDLTAYPDPECLELREALMRHLATPGGRAGRVELEQVLVGNGSTELIHLLARAYLSPPRPSTTNSALQFSPTYGEYSGACRLAGVPIASVNAAASPPFAWDLAAAVRHIERDRPSLVFLCNPNNPTGVYLESEEVRSVAAAVAATGGLLVLDEAYLSFVDDPWDSLDMVASGNVVLLRSMTKDYALTALRLGYMIASEDVIGSIAALQPDWSVNGLAQAAGLVALSDQGYLDRARAAVEQAKGMLTQRLGELGFTVHPSRANYLMIDVGDAAHWRERLMRRGLFVRDCASFGLPTCIRVGIRPLADCRSLADAMEELLPA